MTRIKEILVSAIAATAATVVVAVASPTGASAETVTLDREGYGQSLHGGAVDMVIYYEIKGKSHNVVATYATKDKPADAARFEISLNDKASALYTIPGRPDIVYSFKRAGNQTTVSVDDVATHQAKL